MERGRKSSEGWKVHAVRIEKHRERVDDRALRRKAETVEKSEGIDEPEKRRERLKVHTVRIDEPEKRRERLDAKGRALRRRAERIEKCEGVENSLGDSLCERAVVDQSKNDQDSHVKKVDDDSSDSNVGFKSCKNHTHPCKRTDSVYDDCSEFHEELRLSKKVDINHAGMVSFSKNLDACTAGSLFTHKQTCNLKDLSGVFCQLPGENPLLISVEKDVYGVLDPSLSFLLQTVMVRASCKGLLCCQSCDGDNTYYICNPVNQKWRELPKSVENHGPASFVALSCMLPSGLNSEPMFELVCAFGIHGQPGVHFDVYSSKPSSWKLSDTVCYELEVMQLSGNGLFLNGIVFWETLAGCILAYNVKEKQYDLVTLPLNCGPEGAMTEMDGEMCYILPCEEGCQYTLHIYGGLAMNLKRKICLVGQVFNNVTENLRALAIVNDDVVLLLEGSKLIAYHLKSEQVQILRSDG